MCRNEDAFEPKLLCLGNSLLNPCHRTYLAAQSHLASHADVALDGHVAIARQYGCNDTEIDGRVCDSKPTGNVQEDILLCKFESNPLLQDRQEHVQSAAIEARCAPLGSPVCCRADQCLRLDKEGSDAFHRARYGHAREPFTIVREKQLAGVAHLPKTIVPHLIDAQFARAAEAVLDATKDAVKMVLVAFKLQDNVHDVLQNLWPCQRSFLIYMADEQDGYTSSLGVFEQ